MISVKTLWDRIATLSKTGTSGYTDEDEFNNDLYSVQYTVLSVLCDNYENNQKVADFLRRHIKEVPGTTQANGKLYVTDITTNVPDYYRAMSINYVDGNGIQHETDKVQTNGIGMTITSPIRGFSIAKSRTGWYETNDNIQMLPKQALSYSLIYCKKPILAKIAFTTASTDDNDYLVIDVANTVDIDFPEGLFNLFVYFMLECLGIEQKEQLTQEYSQLGINRTIKTDLK